MAQVKHYWTNADGLPVRFGLATEAEKARSRRVVTAGVDQELVVEFSFDNLPGYDKDSNNNGTFDSFERLAVGIPMGPAGTVLKTASLYVTEAWVGGTSLTLGTYEKDGTAITAAGIVNAALTATLTAGAVITGAGAQVGTTLDPADGTHYIRGTVVGTYTAGKAKLVLVYEKVGVPEVAPSKGTVTIV